MTNEFFTANTEFGRVKGKRTTSSLDSEYISFLGIPYAKPPVGELRFKVS
jgi:carboxylesterase type B